MNYEVRWKRTARDELAAAWLAAADRGAVTAAAHQVDLMLQRNPESCGESRAGSRRIVVVQPLVVVFEVNDQKRRVTVLSVRSLA
jgi:hypothetical protein